MAVRRESNTLHKKESAQLEREFTSRSDINFIVVWSCPVRVVCVTVRIKLDVAYLSVYDWSDVLDMRRAIRALFRHASTAKRLVEETGLIVFEI